MKKKDFKKLCLLGLTCGASLAAQGSANAAEGVMLAGSCGGSSPRSFPTSSNYAPSHGCNGQAMTSGYAPSHSCGGQAMPSGYAPAPQHGCNGQSYYVAPAPQGSCGAQSRPQGHGCSAVQAQGNFNRPQDTAQRDNSQWGQGAPNAGNSKNFPSSMTPAQSNNPINNQNMQNPNTTK